MISFLYFMKKSDRKIADTKFDKFFTNESIKNQSINRYYSIFFMNDRKFWMI